jgi:hypothetical protein
VKTNRAKALFPLTVFLILVLPVSTMLLSTGPAQAQDVFESFTEPNNSATIGGRDDWLAQTFTAISTHTITMVKLRIFGRGTPPPDVIVSIKATDSNGHPSGPDLTSGVISSNQITIDLAGQWNSVPLTPITVTAGTRYAIVARSVWANEPITYFAWKSNYIDTSATLPPEGYDGGNMEYTDSTGHWFARDRDFLFEVLGESASTAPRITAPFQLVPGKPFSFTALGASLVAESGIADPGETIPIPIRLDNAQNLGSFGFELDYDQNVAEVTDVTNGSLTSGASFTYNILKPGTILFGYANSADISGSGPIAGVMFKAVGNDGSKCDLKLSGISAINTSKNAITLNPVNGVFSIGQKLLGDGNGDNQITVVDALIALKMYVKAIPEDLIMDVNNDGKVSHEDAFQIMNMAKPTTTIPIFKGVTK